MSRPLLVRRSCLVLAVASMTSHAAAEPVILQNTSNIFGHVTVLQDRMPITIGETFEIAGAPLVGTFSLSDSRTISQLAASATVFSSVAGSISATQFSGRGRTDSTAGADGASPEIGAQSWARSTFNVTFEVLEPTVFRYAARYFADSDALFGGLIGRLEPAFQGLRVFSDEFRFFPGALDESRSHAGLLAPGLYSLILVSDPIFVTAPGETFKTGGYDFTFEMEPVPEPATMLLVGAGLAAVARSGARRRRTRT